VFGGEACSLKVNIIDNYGNPVTGAHIRIAGGGHTSELQQDMLVPFKCGKYTLEITASGARPAAIEVDIQQMARSSRCQETGSVDGQVPLCSVLGKVASALDTSRIRLMEMFVLTVLMCR
jgi:hypothetical protein